MRKILSVVLAILMVSMIVPTMSFAASAGIEDITGLVAGETFKVTPNSAATISVNAKVFDIVDGTVAADGKTESIEVAADTVVTIQVKTSVPVEFTSQIKVNDEFVDVSIKDRKLGDADGDGYVTSADANMLLIHAADGQNDSSFKVVAGDIDGDGYVTSADANEALIYAADGTPSVDGIGSDYLGSGEIYSDEFADNWTTEPATTPLAKPEGIYAYHQNNVVYFTFDAVANAESYIVTVGETSTTVTATSGSIEAAYAENLTISVVATTTNTAYTNSEAGTANVVDATVSGELAAWLSLNGLENVAITVYEITE